MGPAAAHPRSFVPSRQNAVRRSLSTLALTSPMERRPPAMGARPAVPPTVPDAAGPTLSAIANLRLDSELAIITRADGQRIDEIKAYLVAGTLPSVAISGVRTSP